MLPEQLLEQLYKAMPFLKTADAALQQEFLDAGQFVTLPPGQFICMEGNACSGLPIVLRGSARVFKTGETGREITLYRLGTGESCVLTASCILNDQDFPAFAATEDKVEAFLIPSTHFRSWVDQYPAWRSYVFDLMARRLHTVITLLEEVAFRRLDVRLATYLAEKTNADAREVLHTTHEHVAFELGSSREVVSRILKEFEHEGLIRLDRGAIHILDKLKLSDRSQRV